jgi:CRP/FNR family cyclic AMP-dependent transcriptional regulator
VISSKKLSTQETPTNPDKQYVNHPREYGKPHEVCLLAGDVHHYKGHPLATILCSMPTAELNAIPIFKGLDDSHLHLLSPIISRRSYRAEAMIFQLEQPADFLYILKSGEVLVEFKPFDGPRIVIARIRPGDVFGWSAALGHTVYTSSARAVVASSVYRLNGDKLQQLCTRHPETGVIILTRLSAVISNRLSSTQQLIFSHFNHRYEEQRSGIVKAS